MKSRCRSSPSTLTRARDCTLSSMRQMDCSIFTPNLRSTSAIWFSHASISLTLRPLGSSWESFRRTGRSFRMSIRTLRKSKKVLLMAKSLQSSKKQPRFSRNQKQLRPSLPQNSSFSMSQQKYQLICM